MAYEKGQLTSENQLALFHYSMEFNQFYQMLPNRCQSPFFGFDFPLFSRAPADLTVIPTHCHQTDFV